MSGVMNNRSALLNTLAESPVYRRYERAFSSATGLPLALRARESWDPPFRGKAQENEFCALMAKKSAGCAACLRVQEKLSEAACNGAATMKCHFGLSESAVPVKLGAETIGFLATGQVLTQEPTPAQVDKMEQTLKTLGVNVDVAEARNLYANTKVMPRAQFASATRLLEFFAEELAEKSNRLSIRENNAEPVAVVRAKSFIAQNLAEDITLGDIAKAACTSTFYICKLFKRHTGTNLMEYISRLRVERAKTSLQNPQARISEVAYEVGFQSLTHFNRVFRTMVGESPTEFREKSSVALAA
jgi:AraC-like DNA-binding protein/ligand-binding sensor protein